MLCKIKKISDKKKIIIILLIIFVFMIIMNFLTPLIADDFTYSFGLNNKKLSNIGEILIKQKNHYLKWGGRTVAHTIAQFFLLEGKTIFNIANSIIYCIMIYLIYMHVKVNKKENPKILIVIHLLLWFFLPVFGQTCLWLIGSCNYMWTTVLILLFLLPFRQSEEKDTWWMLIGMFLLGIISGWTNENTSFGSLVIGFGLLLLKKLENKKYKFRKWQISGIIGSVLGFIILILAPGNFARNEYFVDNSPIIVKIVRRAINITNNFMVFAFPLLITIIILITIYIYNKKKIQKEVYLYTISGILTAYAMVLSPVFPQRAWTGVIVFFIISICIMIYEIEKINNIFKYAIVDILIIYSVIYVNEYIAACKSVNELRTTWKYRENIIEKAKNSNKKSVELSRYISDNSKNPNFDLDDIVEDSKAFPNIDIARYYEIEEVTLKK